MKDYTDKNIFELMKVPTNELKELSIEELANEINEKRVNIHPFEKENTLSVHGDIYISAMNANIMVKNEDGINRINIFEWDSHLYISLSEKIIFGIYSYENDKSYRIAFEGNSPDLLVTVVDRIMNKRKMQKSDDSKNAIYYEDYRLTIIENDGKYIIYDEKYGGRAVHQNKSKEWTDNFIQRVLNKRKG